MHLPLASAALDGQVGIFWVGKETKQRISLLLPCTKSLVRRLDVPFDTTEQRLLCVEARAVDVLLLGVGHGREMMSNCGYVGFGFDGELQ